jgi:hypothetical protein
MRKVPPVTMNTATLLTRLEALQQELNAIEAQRTTPNADQEPLNDEWERITKEMDSICEFIWNDVEDTRGCATCSGCAYCEDTGSYDPDGEI